MSGVTISSAVYWSDWPNAQDSAFDVRAKSNASWVSAEGELIGVGESRVVGTGTITARRPTLPDIPLPTTTSGLDSQIARWTITLHRVGHTAVVSTVLADFPLPVSFEPAATWAQIKIHKQGKQPLRDTSVYTKAETDHQISLAAGTLNDASAVIKGRTRLSVTPVSSTAPIAVGDNDPRMSEIPPAGAFYYASHYDTFADALVSMGNSRVRLIVSELMTTGNATVPSTVTLEFTGDGMLSVNTGTVLTINGPIIADPIQIFAGVGTVSFASNRSQTVFDFMWMGVVGDDSTDDTVALQSCLDAFPDNANWVLPPKTMKVTTGLTMSEKHNVRLTAAGVTSEGTGSHVPYLKWRGADGGTVLTLNRVRDCAFENFNIVGSASGGSVGADTLLHIRQDLGGGIQISSNNRFQGMTFTAASTRSTVVGIIIGDATAANCEFMRFYECQFYASTDNDPDTVAGTALKITHANAKAIIIQDSEIIGAGIAIQNYGSFQAIRLHGYGVNLVFDIQAMTDPVIIEGNQWESIRQLIKVSTGFAPIHFRNNGIDATATGSSAVPFIQLNGTRFVSDANDIDSNTWEYLFKDMNGQSSLISTNDRWNNTGDVGLKTLGNVIGFNALGSSLATQVVTGTSITNGATPGFAGSGYALKTSTGAERRAISIVNNSDFMTTRNASGAVDTVQVANGEIEIAGLFPPSGLRRTIVGTPGSTVYAFLVMAVDSLGRRTQPSLRVLVSNANATLSGTDYIQLDWDAVPGASTYEAIEFSAGLWRSIASGIATNTYNVTSNPAGAFTYSPPTYNETAKLNYRGMEVSPNEVTFTANDATPSVAIGNDFLTANSAGTSITTFDDATTGQTVYVRVNDTNTTFVNGSGIITTTGANVAATSGRIYVFKRRGSNWIQL